MEIMIFVIFILKRISLPKKTFPVLSKIENLSMRASLKDLLIKIKDSGLTKVEQNKSSKLYWS